jgi:hypothetical protein
MKTLFLVVCTGLVVGCSASKPQPGLIAKQWSDNARQLGISPIYPPRERFEPGDVYLGITVPSSLIGKMPNEFYTVTPKRYGHIDLSKELALEQQRQALPATASYVNEAGTSLTPWNMQDYPATGGRVNGLVAFPGFSFASASDTDLGVNLTNRAWGGLFGFSKKSRYLVSYTVPAAESISVPLDKVLAATAPYFHQIKLNQINVPLVNLGNSMLEGMPQGVKASLVVVTEVYYARAIDVTISATDSDSAQLSATTMKLVDLSEKKAKLQQELLKLKVATPPPPQPPAPNTTQNTIALLESQINDLQANIETSAQAAVPSIPGATGSVSRSSATGVTLRQVFKYPIAIGYRGVSFALDRLDINNPSDDQSGFNMPGG